MTASAQSLKRFKLDFFNLFTSSKTEYEEGLVPSNELRNSLNELKQEPKYSPNTEEVFHQAFDFAPIATALVASSGELFYVNRAFSAMFGFNKGELGEMSLQMLTHDEDLSTLNKNLSKMLEGKLHACHIEVRVQHKQGHFFWTNWAVSKCPAGSPQTPSLIFQLHGVVDRRRFEQRNSDSSFYDQLTGLPNRLLLIERLQVAFNRARLHPNKRLAVFFMNFECIRLDSDGSAEIADEHLFNDVARRIECVLRANDFVAKLDGNEFAALLEDVENIEEVVEIAEHLRKEFAKPLIHNGQEIQINLFAGIALWSRDYDRSEYLLRDATSAFYHAKRLGRTHYEIYDSEIHKRARYLLQLEKDLWSAVDRKELCLRYQPIIELKTCQLVGFEALLRWKHPVHGIISPIEFVSIAEENGAIASIGSWVLEEACRQLRVWQKCHRSSKNLWMSVNVSGKQLLEPNLVSQVEAVLQNTGVAPHTLKLEITESAMINNTELAIKTLHDIKKLGVNLSVDDFGTGYSSLSNLHRMPVNSLKIDRSFVTTMRGSEENWEITKSIVELAQSLNLEIIAEGVETGEQVVHLQNLGCPFGQGYYFAQPLDIPAVENLLDELETNYTKNKTPDELMNEYFDSIG